MRFLSDLALFVGVAKTRSFSRAASALGMPTSTLSRRISALERELGIHLIHFSTRTFKLTDAGQACYQQSKAIVAEAMRIQSDLAGIAAKASEQVRAGLEEDADDAKQGQEKRNHGIIVHDRAPPRPPRSSFDDAVTF